MARKRTRSTKSIKLGIIRTIGKPPSMLVPDAVTRRVLRSLNKPKRKV